MKQTQFVPNRRDIPKETSEAIRPPAIHEAMGNVREALEQAESQVSAPEERLIQVSEHEPPSPDKNTVQGVPTTVPLAGDLHALSHRIFSMADKLRSMRNRLAV